MREQYDKNNMTETERRSGETRQVEEIKREYDRIIEERNRKEWERDYIARGMRESNNKATERKGI